MIPEHLETGGGVCLGSQPWAVLQLGFLPQISNISAWDESTGQEEDGA